MEAVDQVIQLVNGILQDVLGNPPVTPTKASIHSRLAVLLPQETNFDKHIEHLPSAR